ncbi:MAG: peptidoglycan-binding protein [Acidimicrobiia bacterium]
MPASTTGVNVLRRDSTGKAVRDLQQRLAAAGYVPVDDEAGIFGPATEVAVRAFQDARGIRVDGVCGPETWAALVESGFALGDRLLYERSPNLRGDDVSELQHRLNVLGFDAGREDGILGRQSAGALREFQRNSGLSVDGILGPETLRALSRVGSLTEGSVAAVREREELREPRHLSDHRVYVAVAPEFQTLGDVIGRTLSGAGAQTITDLSGEDDSTIAARANQYHADLFIGVRAGDRPGCRCHYFASGEFRSEAGYRVAQAIQAELEAMLGVTDGDGASGRTFAILRETRMAAVVVEPVGEHDVDAMGALVAAVADVAAAITRGIRRGIEEQPADLSVD